MTYQPHTRVSLLGAWLGDSPEIFANTIAVVDSSDGPIGDLVAYLASCQAAIATAWHACLGIPDGAQLTSLKAANIGPDGKYTQPPEEHVYAPSIHGGAATSSTVPGFCSLALTWKSDNFRPPGKYGRIYPPNPSYGVIGTSGNSQFQTGVSNQNNNITFGLAILDALKTGGNIPVIASKVLLGENAVITTVSCDSVYDTQRRRKNRIVGTRVTTANPYP
uniref:Uncharacterized protein n=1 Tax=uncultured prokaryote TaxID=198431 RepID=A0A0H5Q2I5_9ZZZZ|nr:hypothetical protein [uncultured prokaryote]